MVERVSELGSDAFGSRSLTCPPQALRGTPPCTSVDWRLIHANPGREALAGVLGCGAKHLGCVKHQLRPICQESSEARHGPRPAGPRVATRVADRQGATGCPVTAGRYRHSLSRPSRHDRQGPRRVLRPDTDRHGPPAPRQLDKGLRRGYSRRGSVVGLQGARRPDAGLR
jgi:hypothetical protein